MFDIRKFAMIIFTYYFLWEKYLFKNFSDILLINEFVVNLSLIFKIFKICKHMRIEDAIIIPILKYLFIK